MAGSKAAYIMYALLLLALLVAGSATAIPWVSRTNYRPVLENGGKNNNELSF
jgi:hypothetical protein